MFSRIIQVTRPLFVLTLLFLYSAQLLALAKVTNARVWDAPEYTRLVLDLSKSADHKVLVLKNPHRLVLDIKRASKALRFDKLALANTPIKAVRSARRNENDLRVVLDLKEPAKPKSFMLKPNATYGHRLVLDLYTTKKKSNKKESVKRAVKDFDIVGSSRDIVIVIDPGHGGEDPGAIGPNRLKEKDVVLAISRELRDQLNQKRGFKAFLTRDRDYYIGLRKRTKIARNYNADLLVSVHADAFKKEQAHGASVFALSTRGATSETARWLAKKENSADLIGGVGSVSLEDKDDVLAGVLLDLSSTASLKASLTVGDRVLKSMGGVARLHKKSVQQAGFVVLKSPDIPSILVETGFISNRAESKRLKTSSYQKKMAKAIRTGVVKYFADTPPPGTYLANKLKGTKFKNTKSKRYVVKKGDTLSQIATRNRVSVKDIRQLNRLSNDTVWVGQKIKLPSS